VRLILSSSVGTDLFETEGMTVYAGDTYTWQFPEDGVAIVMS